MKSYIPILLLGFITGQFIYEYLLKPAVDVPDIPRVVHLRECRGYLTNGLRFNIPIIVVDSETNPLNKDKYEDFALFQCMRVRQLMADTPKFGVEMPNGVIK